MRRGSAPPGDSATRITGIALGPIFFAPRRGIVCMWTEISYIWHPDATSIKQNVRGTAGDNRFNCNRILRAAVYDVPPAPPGDSAGQKIALIATGLYCNPFITMSLAFSEIHSVHSANAFLNDQYCELHRSQNCCVYAERHLNSFSSLCSWGLTFSNLSQTYRQQSTRSL